MIRKINTSFNVYWTATFDGYDGAPDSRCAIGHGTTELEAMANLIQHAEDLEGIGHATGER